ncbi:uncharacterized protein [Primulina huaijiensis]|uniref:uncharacterized protein n=1 Tax=Primulina huaijiensis TaxID=1492673 RepID=UPI003CC733DA
MVQQQAFSPHVGTSSTFFVSSLCRQLEQEMETVVKVLQPGPLGIIEHKFTAEEINKAKSTVNQAVENWRRNAYVERNSPFLRDFIGHDRM